MVVSNFSIAFPFLGSEAATIRVSQSHGAELPILAAISLDQIWFLGSATRRISTQTSKPFGNSLKRDAATHTHRLQVGWFVEVLFIDLFLALRRCLSYCVLKGQDSTCWVYGLTQLPQTNSTDASTYTHFYNNSGEDQQEIKQNGDHAGTFSQVPAGVFVGHRPPHFQS